MPVDGNVLLGLAVISLLLVLVTYFATASRSRSKIGMLESKLSSAQELQEQLQADALLATQQHDAAAKVLRDREDDCLRLEKEKEFFDLEKKRLLDQLTEYSGELSTLREGQAELSAAKARTTSLQRDLEELKAERQLLRASLEKQTSEAVTLATEREQQEESLRAQKEFIKNSSESLNQQFENLANKVFEQKGKQFAETNQTTLGGILKPLQEQIAGFQSRVNEVHDASTKSHTSLQQAVDGVKDLGLKIGKDASNLTTALKGDSQQRGAWGEAQLQRTLEISGLIEGDHYTMQDSFSDSAGKVKRTDFLVRLPEDRQLIIDSKVTLNAYERTIAAETPEQYERAMTEHVMAVRKHIDELASKDYTRLTGMKSPSYVLMFMPMESAYIEALKHNKELFQYGFNKQVVLVSHTTLIPILRTVANLWMLERSNAEAREISDMAADIYNKVTAVAEGLRNLGGSLTTVGNHYNKAVVALAGKQGLFGKVEKFEKISAKISKALPDIEPRDFELETGRLDLVLEPIDEPDSALPELPEESGSPVETNQQGSAADTGSAQD
ncbi:MAG: DNA recombination protein RmuC [Luminiphilus sp.]|nr:DNA recombination protein RmuC [Luminiphilus sp.]